MLTDDELAAVERAAVTMQNMAHATPSKAVKEQYSADAATLRALTDRARNGGWQTIDGVPDDVKQAKTAIMLGCEGLWSGEGWFDAETDSWYETNNHPTDAWGGPIYPTHWMPLPEPPKGGE